VFSARLKWVQDIYFAGFEGAESFNLTGSLWTSQATSTLREVPIRRSGLDAREILSERCPRGRRRRKRVRLNDVTIDKAGRIYLVSTQEGRSTSMTITGNSFSNSEKKVNHRQAEPAGRSGCGRQKRPDICCGQHAAQVKRI
jgi:hypothetical protein